MAALLVAYDLGLKGVNVDESPLQQEDGVLRKAQNAISNPLGAEIGLSSRPGFGKFSDQLAGEVLGGIGVPLADLFSAGGRFWFIGRGPKT